MAFFTVTSTMTTDVGAPVSFVFQTDDKEVPDLEALRDVFAEEGCCLGIRYKLNTRDRQLMNPKKTLIGREGFIQIVEYPQAAAMPVDGTEE